MLLSAVAFYVQQNRYHLPLLCPYLYRLEDLALSQLCPGECRDNSMLKLLSDNKKQFIFKTYQVRNTVRKLLLILCHVPCCWKRTVLQFSNESVVSLAFDCIVLESVQRYQVLLSV